MKHPFARLILARFIGLYVRQVNGLENLPEKGYIIAANHASYADDVFVNAKLIEEGYAKILMIPPNTKHAEYLLSLQRKAKSQQKGIWSR